MDFNTQSYHVSEDLYVSHKIQATHFGFQLGVAAPPHTSPCILSHVPFPRHGNTGGDRQPAIPANDLPLLGKRHTQISLKVVDCGVSDWEPCKHAIFKRQRQQIFFHLVVVNSLGSLGYLSSFPLLRLCLVPGLAKIVRVDQSWSLEFVGDKD